MDLTLFGALTILAGIYALYSRPEIALILLLLFSTANAAGTISIGSASIPPLNLFGFFFILRAAILPAGIHWGIKSFEPPRTGFVLAIMMAFAAVTAVFFPMILQGVTNIFYSDRTLSTENALLSRPLASGSGNITQTLYALEGLAVFAAAHVYIRYVTSQTILKAFLALALLNIVLGLVDTLTHATGTSFLMDPLRSGGYHIHAEQVIGSFRRIIGSFPEPSAFAAFSFQLFVGTFILWQFGVGGYLTPAVMIGNLAFLLLSTSTSGYAALFAFTAIVILWLAISLIGNGLTKRAILAGLVITAALVGAAGIYAFNAVPEPVAAILEATLNKTTSQSGVERAAMNTQAWQNFVDTYGLGAGLGSARASSFLFVLLSNIGIIGAILFVVFIAKILSASSAHGDRSDQVTTALAKSQIVSTLVAAVVAAGVFDLGTLFYLWCGTISALAFRYSVTREPYLPNQALKPVDA